MDTPFFESKNMHINFCNGSVLRVTFDKLMEFKKFLVHVFSISALMDLQKVPMSAKTKLKFPYVIKMASTQWPEERSCKLKYQRVVMKFTIGNL